MLQRVAGSRKERVKVARPAAFTNATALYGAGPRDMQSRIAELERRAVASVIFDGKQAALNDKIARDAFLSSARYNYEWALRGGDLHRPAPKPFGSEAALAHRSIMVHGSTVPEVITVTAGATLFLFQDPFNKQGPVRYYNGVAAATNSYAWDSTVALLQDATAPSSYVPWRGYAPFNLVEDTDSFSVNNEFLLPNGNRHPPLIQTAATTMSVEVALPYSGTATLFTLSSADGVCGFKTGGEKVVGGIGESSSAFHPGVQPGLRGSIHCPVGTVSSSPAGLCAQAGKLSLLVGPITRAARVVGLPDETWHYAGQLSVVDAPLPGAISTSENFMPRDKPEARAKYGIIVIQNTGATNLSVMVSSSFCLHTIVQSDTSDRTIPAIMTSIHQQAKPITQHRSAAGMPMPSSTHYEGSLVAHPNETSNPGYHHVGESSNVFKTIWGAIKKGAGIVRDVLDSGAVRAFAQGAGAAVAARYTGGGLPSVIPGITYDYRSQPMIESRRRGRPIVEEIDDD